MRPILCFISTLGMTSHGLVRIEDVKETPPPGEEVCACPIILCFISSLMVT